MDVHLVKTPEAALALPGQRQQHAASIGRIGASTDDLQPDHPVHELDCGVMPNEHVPCEIADRHRLTGGKPLMAISA